MASSEVIQKDVAQNPEIKGNPDVIKKEEVMCTKSKESVAVPSSGNAQQESSQQQQHHPQQPIQNQQPVARTRSSREEKMRKKDDKSVDHVLKALNSLNTTEEKLAAMCKKYADIFDENRKMQLALKQAEKRCSTLQREKEQLQTDHSKAILTRSRLENLCRELQRQNKAIKDESLLKIREEEEKRKEVSTKFQATLNEITTLMQQNNDKNMKLRDDNIDMNAKLKNVCEKYELREQQVEKISKQMQLEAQLADAKLAKAKMEMAAEREIMLREKQQLLMELSQYQTRCQEFQATEINLRNQITMYDEKYDEFQKALARSNEVFGGFKGEMEKMSKKMCKLEKEVSTWKQRWEGSHRALLEMAEEKQKADQELSQSNRQVLTLQRLCRTLQGERSNLLAKLKGTSPVDEKIDVSMNKVNDVMENTSDKQLINSDAQNVPQPLVNGDISEDFSVTTANTSDKNLDNSSKIPNYDENRIIEIVSNNVLSHVTDNVVKSDDKLGNGSCESSSEVLLESIDQSPSLSTNDNSICQPNEQSISNKKDLSTVDRSHSSNENNLTTSSATVINGSSELPTSIVAGIESPIVNSNLSSLVEEKCVAKPSDDANCVTKSVDSLQQALVSPPVITESSNETASPAPLLEQSVTNLSTSIDNPVPICDKMSVEKNSKEITPLDVNSSVEYTVTDVLKTTKILPTASHDKANKQSIQVPSHDIPNKEDVKENCLMETKQKLNEQPVKKQSTEPKKGKDSRKKKKNT